MSSIQLLNPLDLPNWDDLIRCHPAATPFHSSGWARVLRDTYGFTPYYACVFKGETLSACLPLMEVNSFLTGRRGVSLPFTDFCAPLLNGTVSSQELTDFAIALGRDRRWKYLELRSNEYSTNSTTSPSLEEEGRGKREDGSNSLGLTEGEGRWKMGDGSEGQDGRGKREEGSNGKNAPERDGRGKMEATAETGALRSALSAQSNYQEDRRGKMEDGRKGTANPNIPTFRHSNTPQSGLSIIPSFQYSSTETKAFTSFSHHLLDLTPGLDRLFKGLRESTRRNIRKSEKEGVSVRFATDLGAVETYFRLHCLTRKRHGVPPQPYSFFAKLHQHLIAPGQGMVALAEYQGLAVAGAIFLTLGDRAIFKFGASDSRYHLQRPNDRIMWEAIRRLAESGLGSLSFGRTDLSHKGLIQFKSSWGGGEKISFYVRFGLMVGDNVWNSVDSHPLVSRIFQKLPTPLLRLFGHVFYKHFGV